MEQFVKYSCKVLTKLTIWAQRFSEIFICRKILKALPFLQLHFMLYFVLVM